MANSPRLIQYSASVVASLYFHGCQRIELCVVLDSALYMEQIKIRELSGQNQYLQEGSGSDPVGSEPFCPIRIRNFHPRFWSELAPVSYSDLDNWYLNQCSSSSMGCNVARWGGCSIAQFRVQCSRCPVLGSILTRWLLMSSPEFKSHPAIPPPRAAQEQEIYHQARSDPALEDSRDEYCII
jgi:hypothetical protein